MTPLWSWVGGWALLGLAIAGFWLVLGVAFDYPYPLFVFQMFPGAFFTGVREIARPTTGGTALMCAVALASNALLYGFAGLLSWPLRQALRRWQQKCVADRDR